MTEHRILPEITPERQALINQFKLGTRIAFKNPNAPQFRQFLEQEPYVVVGAALYGNEVLRVNFLTESAFDEFLHGSSADIFGGNKWPTHEDIKTIFVQGRSVCAITQPVILGECYKGDGALVGKVARSAINVILGRITEANLFVDCSNHPNNLLTVHAIIAHAPRALRYELGVHTLSADFM